MIRIADRYPQACNIYISAICDGPSASYGAKVSNIIKEQSERQGRQFVMGLPRQTRGLIPPGVQRVS